jgi:beta-N-acetylhexosaminidase
MTKIAVTLLALGLLAGCSGKAGPETPSPTGGTASASGDKTSPTDQPPAPDKATAVWNEMSTEARLGQLVALPVVVGPAVSQTAGLVADKGFGTVIYTGPAWSQDLAKSMSADLREAAGAAGLWIAADQEGGRVLRFQGSGFTVIPNASTQGKWPVDELRAQAGTWGGELAAVGVNLNLAPVADTVPGEADSDRMSNPPIGAQDRDFRKGPAGNAERCRAVIEGMASSGVSSAVKYFPGLGRLKANPDLTAESITDTVTAPGDSYMTGFAETFPANPAMVVISLGVYPNIDPSVPAVYSPAVIDATLRGAMGWQGVVMSSSLSTPAAAGIPVADRAIAFVAAGGDIAVFGTADNAQMALDGLIARAQTDAEFKQRAESAALRVLQAKERAGLLT